MPSPVTRISRFCWLLLAVLCLVAVDAARAQDTTILPQAQVGKPYSISIGVDTENGKGQLSWKLAQGDLPPGLLLSVTGKIEGTPTGAKTDPYVFDLSVSDSSQPPQSAVLHFSIAVLAAQLRIKAVTATTTALKVIGVNAVEATSNPTPAVDPPAAAKPPAVKPNTKGPAALTDGSAPAVGGSGQAAADNANADKGAVEKKPADDGNPSGQISCSKPNDNAGYCGGPLLRTIVGFEQAGVSAAESKQNFFFDLLYDRPLGPRVDPDLGAALRGWGNLRISSVPQQVTTSVAQFAADFAQQVGNLKVNQVAQSFEFLGGIEYRLLPVPPKKEKDQREKSRQDAIGYAIAPPFNTNLREVVSLNLIVGGGVITPLTPQDSVKIFDVPTNQPSFLTQYPQANGKQFVAFTLPDRNRFFRQAYAGFRLKSHFLGDTARVRYPETFDITYGFNESITGGQIHGGVLRLEGFVPIPYAPASWIYFFGTGMFKPGGHAVTTSPFLLQAAPAGTLPTDPNAVVITTPQANRDYYRIGMGVDFIELVKNWGKKPPTTAVTPVNKADKKTNQ